MGQYTPVHHPELLAEHAVKYTQDAFIAEQVLPPHGVDSLEVKYLLFTREDSSRIPDTEMAADGEANQLKYTKTAVTVDLEPDGLFDRIPVEELESQSDGGDDELDTIESLTDGMLMKHEKRVSDLLMTAASYASTNKVTLANAWTDHSLGTPIADIQTGKRACARPPNVMVMDEVSWDALTRHPDIVEFLGGMNREGMPNTGKVAEYFGLENVYVGKVKYNSANEGATASYSYIWPTGIVLIARIAQEPKRGELTLARSYRKKYGAGDGNGASVAGASREMGGGWVVTQTVEETRGTKGTLYLKVAGSAKSVLVAADAGYLISSAAS
jgi:hypothetical protein